MIAIVDGIIRAQMYCNVNTLTGEIEVIDINEVLEVINVKEIDYREDLEHPDRTE